MSSGRLDSGRAGGYQDGAPAEAFLNAFLYVAVEELKAGGDVPLPDFGKFTVKSRPARKASPRFRTGA